MCHVITGRKTDEETKEVKMEEKETEADDNHVD